MLAPRNTVLKVRACLSFHPWLLQSTEKSTFCTGRVGHYYNTRTKYIGQGDVVSSVTYGGPQNNSYTRCLSLRHKYSGTFPVFRDGRCRRRSHSNNCVIRMFFKYPRYYCCNVIASQMTTLSHSRLLAEQPQRGGPQTGRWVALPNPTEMCSGGARFVRSSL